jgi:hypothetical protein
MSDRTVALVFGYLRGVDHANPTAKRLQLPARFAVVFDSHRPDQADMFFDCELAVAVLSEILEQIPHDTMVLTPSEGAAALPSISAWETHYWSTPESDREPFHSMQLLEAGRPVCYVELEPWVQVGGPSPYHDSWTFSFYLRDYDRGALERAITESCQANQAVLEQPITGAIDGQ